MCLLLLFSIFKLIACTVDINLSELEYIANHLTPSECENLSNYLHSPTYEVTTIRGKKRFYSFGDMTCLELLLHWNSSPNEGLDQTHVILSHRLKQIGRDDLAEWLSDTIFKSLSMGLNKSVLADPLKDLKEEPTELLEADVEQVSGNNSDMSFYHGEPEWETYDTVAIVVAIFLFIAVIILVCELCGCFKFLKRKKKKVKYIKNKKYNLLPQEEQLSTGEDETANEQ